MIKKLFILVNSLVHLYLQLVPILMFFSTVGGVYVI